MMEIHKLKLLLAVLLCFFAYGISFAGGEQDLSYPMSDGSGTLKLGVVTGKTSRWLTEKDDLLKKDKIVIRCLPLSKTKGFIIEIENRNLPEDTRLGFVFGGYDSPQASKVIVPETCKDNIFNVEGTHVTVYHGKSGALKVTQLVVPVGSDMRLSDGRMMDTPLEVYESGKRTDAPVLAGVCPLQKGGKVYFCVYKQNREADYADFMLPDLFKQENEKR